jgi:hypothetical protein
MKECSLPVDITFLIKQQLISVTTNKSMRENVNWIFFLMHDDGFVHSTHGGSKK